MKRLRPPRTDARKPPAPPRRWANLTSAVAIWPLAILLGGEASATPEAIARETGAPPPPGAPQTDGLQIRGRIGAPLQSPGPIPENPLPNLDVLNGPAAEPIGAMSTIWRNERAPAARAWPPVRSLPTEVAAGPQGEARSLPLWSRRHPPLEPPSAEDLAAAEVAAVQGPGRRSDRSWPRIAAPVFESSPLQIAHETPLVAIDPLAINPLEGEPLEGDRQAPEGPAAERAPEPTTLMTASALAAASETEPEVIEIILTAPSPAPEAAATPARRPRAFPAITPPEPDRTAFAPVPRPDGSLAETLASAVQDALQQNPEIQIAQAQWEDARFGVQESRSALLPSVDVSAARGHERTAPEAGDQSDHSRSEMSLSVRQNVYDFGATRGAVRSADRVAASAEWAYRARVDTVALEIAEAFLQVLEQDSIVTLAEQNLAAHERILQTVRTQQEFGLVTGADVSRVDARLNAARADLLDQRSALEQARENYRRLLNREPGPLAEPARVEGLIPPTADEAVAMLDERNPQVLQARLLLDSLDEQRGAARAGYLPRFDLELSASSRDNAGGEVGRNEESRAMINMRMPLFDGGAREAAIGRISARIRQAEFEVERAERDAEQAVRNDYSALSSAWEKVDAIEDEVAAAERLVELYDEQFRQGARSVFDLLDGQSTLYQAQVRRESNRTEMRISGYRVLRTLGSLFDTITMPPAAIPQLNRPTPRPRPTSDAAHAAAHDHPTETDAASMPPPPEAWAEDDTIILLPDPDEPIPSGRRSAAD